MSQAAARRRHWLTLRAQYGEPITYRAGDLVVALVAVPAAVGGRQIGTEQMAASVRGLDWLIDPDELVDADGLRIEPRHGHRITRADGTEYRVQPTDTAASVWRWSDSLQTWRRVNTEAA